MPKHESFGKFYDWMKEADKGNEDNLCPPGMSSDDALHMLSAYLMGEHYYTFSLTPTQSNTELVYDILSKYSPKFRAERKRVCETRNSR